MACPGLAMAGGVSFDDGFSSFDAARWSLADQAPGGQPTQVYWRADHVGFDGATAEFRLNAAPCRWAPEQCGGLPFAAGRLLSDDTYGFGRYTAVLQAASESGVVTDFMSVAGADGAPPLGLVGMHIQGEDPTRLQVSALSLGGGVTYHTVDLGFDASAGMHAYAFDWQAGSVRWFVDGVQVHTLAGAAVPAAEGRIVADLWAASPLAAPLFGPYDGTPVLAHVDRIAFEAAAPVPEPASTAMFGAGAALLAWARRRARVRG